MFLNQKLNRMQERLAKLEARLDEAEQTLRQYQQLARSQTQFSAQWQQLLTYSGGEKGGNDAHETGL